jgi:hypothetical protein
MNPQVLRALVSLGGVGITALVVLGSGIAIYFWYRNYFANIRAAGGESNYWQSLWQKEFGFAPNEKLTHWYQGMFYLGELRPDLEPSGWEHAAAAFERKRIVGIRAAFALSDHGRLAISRGYNEQHDSFDVRAQKMMGAGTGNVPYAVFGPNPRPTIVSAEEAFAAHPALGAQASQAPLFASKGGTLSGRIVHIVSPQHPQGLTLWIEPEGLSALRSWSLTGQLPPPRA